MYPLKFLDKNKQDKYEEKKDVATRIENASSEEHAVDYDLAIDKKMIDMKLRYKKYDEIIRKTFSTHFTLLEKFSKFGLLNKQNIKMIDADFIYIARFRMVRDTYSWIWGYADKSDMPCGKVKEIIQYFPDSLNHFKQSSFMFQNVSQCNKQTKDIKDLLFLYIDETYHFDTIYQTLELDDGFYYLFGLNNVKRVREKFNPKIPNIISIL